MTRRIFVFDTSLRDGEQAAGTRLGPKEKVEIARQLDRLGVDIIEAGFPCSSPLDFESVKLIARELKGPVVCGLTRAVKEDIDVCARALEHAARPRIHTGLGVSDIHIAGKFGGEKYGTTLAQKKATVVEMSVAAVRQSRSFVDDVEFYTEDAARADRAFLFEIIEAVIAAGATVINVPDTTGYSVPEQFGGLIRDIRGHVPNIGRAVVSVHCHDDLGMAVANTLAGVANGADQVEATINGVGERAGNASLEEIVMSLRVRSDYFGADTQIRATEFFRTSRLVATALGIGVPPNKAVVGANAFAHSSGIHVDGMLKDRRTYEIMKPEDVGMPESRIVLTARTGRHGVRHRLDVLGYKVSNEEMDRLYQRFLGVADKKREVFDEDLIAIVHDEIHDVPESYALESLYSTSGTGAAPTAKVRLRVGGETRELSASGNGPVDAAYQAIAGAAGLRPDLVDYRIEAATGGTGAMGEVTVHLSVEGVRVMGRGASTDIIEASAKAYVDGLNRLAAAKAAQAKPGQGAEEHGGAAVC